MSKREQVRNCERRFPSPEIQAAVLAGGGSRRFGSDKCLARLAGEDVTFLERVVRASRVIAETIVVVGHDRPGVRDKAYLALPDLVPNAGPLVGLQTALRTCPVPYLLLMACDQPFVTSELLERLAARRSEADIVAFSRTGGQPDPLPSLMRAPTMLTWVEACLQAGDRSLKSIFGGPLSVLTVQPTPSQIEALRDIDEIGDLP